MDIELTPTEIKFCTDLFDEHFRIEADSVVQLRKMLRCIDPTLSDTEIPQRLSEVNHVEGHLFSLENLLDFMRMVKQKAPDVPEDVAETTDAFVSLGGHADKTGQIDTKALIEAFKSFDLRVDVDAMIREVDDDESGQISYDEFAQLYKELAAAPKEDAAKSRQGAPGFSPEDIGEEAVSGDTTRTNMQSPMKKKVSRGTLKSMTPAAQLSHRLYETIDRHHARHGDLVRATDENFFRDRRGSVAPSTASSTVANHAALNLTQTMSRMAMDATMRSESSPGRSPAETHLSGTAMSATGAWYRTPSAVAVSGMMNDASVLGTTLSGANGLGNTFASMPSAVMSQLLHEDNSATLQAAAETARPAPAPEEPEPVQKVVTPRPPPQRVQRIRRKTAGVSQEGHQRLWAFAAKQKKETEEFQKQLQDLKEKESQLATRLKAVKKEAAAIEWSQQQNFNRQRTRIRERKDVFYLPIKKMNGAVPDTPRRASTARTPTPPTLTAQIIDAYVQPRLKHTPSPKLANYNRGSQSTSSVSSSSTTTQASPKDSSPHASATPPASSRSSSPKYSSDAVSPSSSSSSVSASSETSDAASPPPATCPTPPQCTSAPASAQVSPTKAPKEGGVPAIPMPPARKLPRGTGEPSTARPNSARSTASQGSTVSINYGIISGTTAHVRKQIRTLCSPRTKGVSTGGSVVVSQVGVIPLEKNAVDESQLQSWLQ